MPEYLAPGVFTEQVSFRSKSIEGVSTSTTAFVGPTRKGPLSGSPEVITNPGEFERIYGGIADLDFAGGTTNFMAHAVYAYFNNGGKRLYVTRVFIPQELSNGIAAANITGAGTTRFVARHPGSGYNGNVTVYEKRKLVTDATRNNAPDGSLLSLTVGDADAVAQPARKTGGIAPFNLTDGATLTLDIDGSEETITFNAVNAEVTGEAVGAPPDTTGLTFTVTINGAEQSIALPNGATPLQDIVNLLNAEIRHAYVTLNANQITVGTDLAGTAASISVNQIDQLGFTAAANKEDEGDGNVANIESVTVGEIAAICTTAALDVSVATNGDGHLLIATQATGEDVTLGFNNAAPTSVMTILGLTAAPESGSDGATQTLYVKNGSTWSDTNDNPLAENPVGTQEIVLFNLEAVDADGVRASYEDLGFISAHPRFVGHVLRETPTSKSEALENLYYYDDNAALDAFTLHQELFAAANISRFTLTGGNDGVEPLATSAEVEANSYADALDMLETIDDISIVAAPGHSALNPTTFATVQGQLVGHCERLKYRYAVLDTPPNQTINEARAVRAAVDSTYAALYYPWVTVANPLWRPGQDNLPREINLPPSGFMTGIYARNDINRGVWKSPANEVVRGAIRFERDITNGQQEVLNPEGINCLRFFFGRGYRVWGARSATSDPEYKYVNLQRQMIYLQHSIFNSTQWAVFEPNGPRLWANITDTVNSFLRNEWRNGALLGSTPEQAFQVRCGRETMTQANLDNGQLICEVGVALLRPAEFVIFRIGQKTADAQ
ncbi:phage tail sheath subtilisin-like domain-containing protein [Aliikangiella maris]|uniref:Phage tail sheath subtilisin-like domain-containing protein n=2 Tax=Aliikangiella maris TaxID=3162458 RepID=A0ABV3MKJ6_9GAMM